MADPDETFAALGPQTLRLEELNVRQAIGNLATELQEARTRTHPPPALECALRHIPALSQLKLVEMAHPL